MEIHYGNDNKDSYCFDCEYYYEDVNKTIEHIESFKPIITCLANIYEANVNAKFPLKMMKTCIKILSDLLYSQCDELLDLKVKVNRLTISSQQTEISSGHDNTLTKLHHYHHHHHHYKELLTLTKGYYDHLLNKYDYDPVIWSFYSEVIYEMVKYFENKTSNENDQQDNCKSRNEDDLNLVDEILSIIKEKP